MEKVFFVQTNYGSHRVVCEPDERHGYVVTVPTLHGVITWGKNLAHAKEMAQEAIELCIESLVQKRSDAHTKSISHPNKSKKVLVRV